MIRYVWITALLGVLCIVLYIPSAVPPERFLEVLRAEHAGNERLWGGVAADRVLARMLDLQQERVSLSTPPGVHATQSAQLDADVAHQVGQMTSRLFGNPYFRSIDSLSVLVTYRLSAIVELLSLLAVFAIVVTVDGLVLRRVRARELVPHSAEIFAGSVAAGIALGSVVVVAWLVPLELHPTWIVVGLLAMLFALSRGVANYHVIR